jgi:hypothetical protein
MSGAGPDLLPGLAGTDWVICEPIGRLHRRVVGDLDLRWRVRLMAWWTDGG